MLTPNRESNNCSTKSRFNFNTKSRRWIIVIGDLLNFRLMDVRKRMKSLIGQRIRSSIKGMGRIRRLRLTVMIGWNMMGGWWSVRGGIRCEKREKIKKFLLIWLGRKWPEPDLYYPSMMNIKARSTTTHHDSADSPKSTNSAIRMVSAKLYLPVESLMRMNNRNQYLFRRNIIINL